MTDLSQHHTLGPAMGVRIVVHSSWSKDPEEEPARYEFTQERIVIGRAASADVQLPHAAVSGTHAVISVQGPSHTIVDLDSTNGTRVNGEQIPAGRAKLLRSNDVIDLGGFRLTLEVGIPIGESTTSDQTTAVARRLIRGILSSVDQEPEPPSFTVIEGPDTGRNFRMPPPPVTWTIGRAEHCDIPLRDPNASREHVEVIRDLEGVLVRDLHSRNGVSVNGRKVDNRRLRDRDELGLGTTTLTFEDPAAAALAEVEGRPDEAMSLLPIHEGKGLHGYTEDEHEGGVPSELPEAESKKSTRPKAPKPRFAETIVIILALSVLAMSAIALYWILKPVE